MPDPVFNLVKAAKEVIDQLAHLVNEGNAKANVLAQRITDLEEQLATVPDEKAIRKQIIEKLLGET